MAVAAVCYARSSKDRADIAIDVQVRELTELARSRGYVIVQTFADVVESGKDEDRPGLQALLAELFKKDRTWTVVLALDTSRIARRAAAAYWFEDRECRPRGVSVVYKNLPDMDEAERAIVKAVFHGVDEWHSLVSKRKAIAGMRENVRKGHRAGGRPPTGYQLEHAPTGAVRDGAPVLKSRLVPSPLAPRISAYLKDRAAGIPRHRALKKHGLALPQTSLIGIERNALVYAGHTVWNRHGERGRVDAAKFRPEAEWEVKRDTHEALITDEEARAILEGLKSRARARSRPKKHDYLLAGLLRSPAGLVWHGEKDPYSAFYRAGRSRRVLARRVDQAVVSSLTEDLAGGRLAAALLEHMRARLLVQPDLRRAAALRRAIAEADRKIRRFAELAAQADTPAPLLRMIGEKETERDAAAAELEQLEREQAARAQLEAISEDQVKDALRGLAVDVAAARDVPGLRDVLLQLLERVEMDPADPSEVVLKYRLPSIDGSSPGYSWRPHSDASDNPVPWLERRVKLAA
jgi:site-specific DNA recombinase